jgi:hypothetical protein
MSSEPNLAQNETMSMFQKRHCLWSEKKTKLQQQIQELKSTKKRIVTPRKQADSSKGQKGIATDLQSSPNHKINRFTTPQKPRRNPNSATNSPPTSASSGGSTHTTSSRRVTPSKAGFGSSVSPNLTPTKTKSVQKSHFSTMQQQPQNQFEFGSQVKGGKWR